MAAIHLKVARIGNSRDARIPAPTLARFRIGDSVIMEERADGILLRPIRAAGTKLSWDDTALAMATEAENWSAWDGTIADGLDRESRCTQRPAAPHHRDVRRVVLAPGPAAATQPGSCLGAMIDAATGCGVPGRYGVASTCTDDSVVRGRFMRRLKSSK